MHANLAIRHEQGRGAKVGVVTHETGPSVNNENSYRTLQNVAVNSCGVFSGHWLPGYRFRDDATEFRDADDFPLATEVAGVVAGGVRPVQRLDRDVVETTPSTCVARDACTLRPYPGPSLKVPRVTAW